MSVEDFLDRSQNFARAVGKEEFKKIYMCIKGSLKNLSHFMEGKIEETKFKEGLFGSFPLVTSSENFINEQQVDLKRSKPFHDSAIFDDIAVKRARPTEAIEEVQDDISSAPTDLAIFDGIAVKRARPSEAIEEVQHDIRSAPADLAIFDGIAVKRARPSEAIEEVQHDIRSAPADLASSSIQLNPPTFQFQPSNQNHLHSKSVHQPRYSSQSSIPHSRSRRNPPLPTAPYSGYMSQHYSQLPSAPHSQFALRYNLQQPSAPNSGFRPQYNLEHPSAPNSGFRPQYNLQHPSAPNSGFRPQYNLQHPSAFNSGFPPWYNLQQPSAPNFGFWPQYHPQVPLTPPMGHGIEQQQFTSERNYLPNRRLSFPENGDGSLSKLFSTYSTQGLQRPKQPYVPSRWANGSDY
ncbi:Uncharacterized protein M6B38_112155 [Iris pallida]|uniref:Uncharacterized protein n=1 Tax=Iris pallida TaxID=29817 RepID=A0AAX6DMK4_IRIPA|nr:Uncharacterized protein M6B38_112155 [Iris pallida]